MGLIQISKRVVSKVSFGSEFRLINRYTGQCRSQEDGSKQNCYCTHWNVYPKSIFEQKREKECIPLSKPQFYYNVWFKVVKITRAYFHDEAV